MSKKIILAVALVALMVPTTFAATQYLHSDGTWSGLYGGQDTGTKDADGNPIFAPAASNPDREQTDGGNTTGPWEVKAESYNWPATYDFIEAATLRVRMEVGYWIKLNTKDLWLTLKQVEIHKYAGSVNVGVECNTAIQVQASFAKASGMPTMDVDSLSLNDGGDTATINAGGATLKVYLKLKNVDVKNFNADTQVGKCIQIGTITLKVRPVVKPTLSGAC
jgi:hypothetical protein